MKLKDLLLLCRPEWLSDFKAILEEGGPSKRSKVFAAVVTNRSESDMIMAVYKEVSEKTKKTFNQTTSTLYKDFLTHLLIHHRQYPDILLADLRVLLANAEEEEFLRRADMVERILTDCEAFDHQISFYHLLQDHHFQNKYKATVYKEYTSKLRKAIEHVSAYASIEEYYLKEDLGQKGKRGKWEKKVIERHLHFYRSFFTKEHPDKTQIRARLFCLKTLKINDYFNLTSSESQQLSEEAFTIMTKRPYLYFNLPEIAEFSNLSYRLYTALNIIQPDEVNHLLNSYFEKINDDNLIQLYPRIVQALITSQARYYGGRAGLKFIDDPEPMDPEIESGLLGLLPMVGKIRNRPNFIEKGERLYGLETEALCRMHLPGDHRMEAARLFELIRVQEQQVQHVMGAHMIHVNLLHCYYWAKRWGQLLEEVEKYKRFIKSKGELNPLITQILIFSEMIGKLMLGEIEMSPTEIESKSRDIFKNHPEWYDSMAVYSMNHLKLAEVRSNPE